MTLGGDRRIEGEGTTEQEWQSWNGWHQAPAADLDDLVPAGRRLVVIAPHPDDETLGAGGLISDAVHAGRAVLIIAVTDGDASHPGSTDWPVHRLREQRTHERMAALEALGVQRKHQCVERLQVPDGGAAAAVMDLESQLASRLASTDVVVVPWLLDGHPDHEATSQAGGRAARAVGAAILQMPIWGWHWASPSGGQLPVDSALIYRLAPATLAAKRRAVGCFDSQLHADASTTSAPVLQDWALQRWLRDSEVFFR